MDLTFPHAPSCSEVRFSPTVALLLTYWTLVRAPGEGSMRAHQACREVSKLVAKGCQSSWLRLEKRSEGKDCWLQSGWWADGNDWDGTNCQGTVGVHQRTGWVKQVIGWIGDAVFMKEGCLVFSQPYHPPVMAVLWFHHQSSVRRGFRRGPRHGLNCGPRRGLKAWSQAWPPAWPPRCGVCHGLRHGLGRRLRAMLSKHNNRIVCWGC